MDTLTRDDMKPAAKKATKIKPTKMYSVRYFTGSECSTVVGFKMRLMPRTEALAVVRFLKARKVDAFASPMLVNIAR